VHLDKWPEHLEKFGGEPQAGREENGEEDQQQQQRVRVILKRDARTLLGDEQMLVCLIYVYVLWFGYYGRNLCANNANYLLFWSKICW
jgi:hypothetical protein